MADEDDDLAGRTVALLQVAIAVIADEASDIAVRPSSPEEAGSVAQRLVRSGEDIVLLARACEVLRRRAATF